MRLNKIDTRLWIEDRNKNSLFANVSGKDVYLRAENVSMRLGFKLKK